VRGTAAIKQVDVIRDSQVVATLDGGESEEQRLTWTDPKPERDLHYYYFRVMQTDGELAWSSPMWVHSQGEVVEVLAHHRPGNA
jgi:hypothetical protein